MDKKMKAALESYGRSLLGAVITAIAIVGNGKSPVSFTVDQWLEVANAIWAATIPVAIRWFNKKDPAFGKIAESVAADAKVKLEAKVRATAKKAPAKKKS
jgi:hypothetical protein